MEVSKITDQPRYREAVEQLAALQRELADVTERLRELALTPAGVHEAAEALIRGEPAAQEDTSGATLERRRRELEVAVRLQRNRLGIIKAELSVELAQEYVAAYRDVQCRLAAGLVALGHLAEEERRFCAELKAAGLEIDNVIRPNAFRPALLSVPSQANEFLDRAEAWHGVRLDVERIRRVK